MYIEMGYCFVFFYHAILGYIVLFVFGQRKGEKYEMGTARIEKR